MIKLECTSESHRPITEHRLRRTVLWHGNALSIAANRISYAFNLRGPLCCRYGLLIFIDGYEYAIRDLRSVISSALVGGVGILRIQARSTHSMQQGMLSPDGRVKFGDNAANGYARGEGCGIVMLKRLSQARRDGDLVYAVEGQRRQPRRPKQRPTAPNPASQEAVLKAAFKDARFPGRRHIREAHGTGTKLGDPIELTVLGRVLVAGCGGCVGTGHSCRQRENKHRTPRAQARHRQRDQSGADSEAQLDSAKSQYEHAERARRLRGARSQGGHPGTTTCN